jgi:hypothetical protein
MPGSGELIWYQDPRHFLNDANFIKFVPDGSMNRIEQLNAIVRFALYLSVLMALVKRSMVPLFIVLFVAAVTWGMHESQLATERSNREGMAAVNDATETDRWTGKRCVRPTLHNPFMNVLSSDSVTRPQRPAACNIEKSDVQRDMERAFGHNLYRDSDDPLDRNTSSRQFYTMPVTTIPGDQTAFAKWLYHVGPTCKEGNGKRCVSLAHRPYVR